MLHKWLEKCLPTRNAIKNHSHTKWLWPAVHHPNLWHLFIQKYRQHEKKE